MTSMLATHIQSMRSASTMKAMDGIWPVALVPDHAEDSLQPSGSPVSRRRLTS